MLQRGRDVHRGHLVVEPVAQQAVRDPGGADGLLGGAVVLVDRAAPEAEDAGVGEQRDARLDGGAEDRLVLGDPVQVQLAARDQQHPVAGPQQPVERLRDVVVRDGDGDPPGGEVTGLGRIADHCGDLGGRDGGEQLVDDQTAELAAGAGDNDAHAGTPNLRYHQFV